MVRQSYVLENMPPGGSSFGGQFHKDAFNAYVYPKPGARRTERQEHRSTACNPVAQHKASVFYTTAKESSEKPSRLKTQLDKWSDAEAKKPKSLWDDAKAKHEAMELLKEEQRKSGERPPTPPVETAPAWDGVRTWCPHPSLLRGVCRLNKPRALDWGIDLTQAKGWDCPFWEAPRHRFEATASMPEARPATPTRSLRWRAAEDWDNPDMHAPYKITHTIPKSNSMVELTRTRIS